MKEYFPLILYIVICFVNILGMVVIAAVMGPKRKSQNKGTVYECGLEPRKDSRTKINVKFYLTAVIFLLFDIELIFLLPWAGSYNLHATLFQGIDFSLFRLGEVGLFMGLLMLGLIFVFRRKALEWD
jgi:NADH-quinone oxidoreductase subunit A